MEKNEYLCKVNKAEEQQFAILSSNYRSEQEERRKAQKKASLLEQENSALKSRNEDMQRRLNEKMDEVADTVRQMAQFMMGKGPVTLSDSSRDAIVAGVREEFDQGIFLIQEWNRGLLHRRRILYQDTTCLPVTAPPPAPSPGSLCFLLCELACSGYFT